MAVETSLSYGKQLVAEAWQTHPWLHHPLFQAMAAGRLSPAQLREVIKQQGAFFLDTVRHAAVRLAAIGGTRPSLDDLRLQRAIIPVLLEEAGEDLVGGKESAHALLYVRLAEGLGIGEAELFGTTYLPHVVIEKNELFQLQRDGLLEALCGGALATESINAEASRRLYEAFRTHYGIADEYLAFYSVHAGVEEEHGAKAVLLVDRLAQTDEARARGWLALRRAITVRWLAADGIAQAIGLHA
ncbi:MAG TPA: iron-containing redox enzyme family protein [Chloroflexota bacterium]|nr:iron-containing redox enzyme family protein [Chloroflexota bacterium]